MTKRYMNILWLLTSLLPAPFLFHYFEYVKHAEATYLLSGCILFILVTGILSRSIKFRYILLLNIITAVISLLLAMSFINDDGWFKPFGRDTVILLTSIPFFIGQLVIRMITKLILK